MPKYLIEFKKSAASALLEYNDQGYLIKYELEPGAFEKAQFEYFLSRFPRNIDFLNKWKTEGPAGTKVKLVEEDLSFEAFYDAYANKVSKKATAEKIWNKMPDSERVKAIKYIQVYDQRLRQTSINKKYPETYLNHQEWNN